MHVLVAGAHGQVGQHVTELLGRSEHDVRGMVRDAAQVDDVEALGAEAVVADLTEGVAHAVQGCDAVIFAAGSGGNDVYGVDRDGAINLIEAAEEESVDRFVMLSAINADTPEESPDALRDYLQAKAAADDRLRDGSLTHTIVRPGALTNDSGTGRIETGENLDRDDGEIPRVDVAETLVRTLSADATRGATFELLAGSTPIEEALRDPLNERSEG